VLGDEDGLTAPQNLVHHGQALRFEFTCGHLFHNVTSEEYYYGYINMTIDGMQETTQTLCPSPMRRSHVGTARLGTAAPGCPAAQVYRAAAL